MVAAIRPAVEWMYLDLTVPVAPYGESFGGLEGRNGVMLRDDGTAEVVGFPKSAPADNRSTIAIEGRIDAEGDFDGTYTEVVTGSLQYGLRDEFAEEPSADRRSAFARGIGSRVFEDAVADSLKLFVGKDLEAEPRLWAHVVAEDILDPAPGGWMLPVRLNRYGEPGIMARLEEDTLRTFPVNAGAVFGRRMHVTEYRFVLPEGWKADLPESVRAESPFGLYESSYAQEGRDLVIRQSIRGADGVLPPDRVDELLEWFRTIHADDVDHIALRPAGG
jgi:hypothetical protein